jgi:hypothetical protein
MNPRPAVRITPAHLDPFDLDGGENPFQPGGAPEGPIGDIRANALKYYFVAEKPTYLS